MPYPEQMELIRDLVLNDHVTLEDTPLALAIYFQSRRFPNEECVFEVLHHFGFDEVSEEKSVFQVQFGPTRVFPLPEGDRLHLFLSNPNEVMYAIEYGWPEINDLVDAIKAGEAIGYDIIYSRPADPSVNRIMTSLKGFANAKLLVAA